MSCTDCDENHPAHPNDAPIPISEQWRHLHWLQAFWTRAWRENITGLSGMVAYNLMLAVFPFVFLVLFIFSQVLQIEGVERGIFNDLTRLFPNVGNDTLTDVVRAIRNNSATLGVAAAVGSLWIGASFWGAMDTAFCRIYHVQCRGWWEQKRFSLGMLAVVTLFLLASVVLPAIEGALIRQTDNLPFGLNEIQNLDNAILFAVTLTLNFSIVSVIYWAVPKGRMPWLAVWPGAVFTTLIAAAANWLFPVYLSNVSTLNRFGSTIGFILIALFWFYLVSLTMLAGAVLNSLRHEYHDTGRLPYGILSRAQLLDQIQRDQEKQAQSQMAEPYRSLVLGDSWPKTEEKAEASGGDAETKVVPLRRKRK